MTDLHTRATAIAHSPVSYASADISALIRELLEERATVSPLSAAWMQRMAAQEAEDHGEPGLYQAMSDAFRSGYADAGGHIADAIRAIQPPAPADLLADALRLLEIRRLVGALKNLHRAVCGETGFAAAVRNVSGIAYPWPALDDADEEALAALAPVEQHIDNRAEGEA